MVKQTVFPMGKFFTRERFGGPQFIAGILLLIFLGQCAWLIAHQSVSMISENELARVQEGLEQWHGKAIAGTPSNLKSESDSLPLAGIRFSPDHSPLWYLLPSATIAVFGPAPGSSAWIWLSRLPYGFIGALLGASVWYVSRRLYGNVGGYIALSLYCFSPAVIRTSALWSTQPSISGVWGAFGAVFTAIAVSHTLYAPREVVLWNWRRILLLGISLALAVGSQFSLVIVVLVVLFLMLYVAPQRKLAAMAILAAASVTALFLLFASYFFHPQTFLDGLSHARFIAFTGRALGMAGAYLLALKEVAACGPVLIGLIPLALLTYVLWPRARYFGNTAPLLVALLFVGLRVAAPHDPESVFSLAGGVFLFVFVAGIAADLVEKKQELIAIIFAVLAANAIWNLTWLIRAGL
jgi:hypothetical protein